MNKICNKKNKSNNNCYLKIIYDLDTSEFYLCIDFIFFET